MIGFGNISLPPAAPATPDLQAVLDAGNLSTTGIQLTDTILVINNSGTDNIVTYSEQNIEFSNNGGSTLKIAANTLTGNKVLSLKDSTGTNAIESDVFLQPQLQPTAAATTLTPTYNAAVGGIGGFCTVNGSDVAGVITLRTGAIPIAGSICSYLFGTAYGTIPIVTITPANPAAQLTIVAGTLPIVNQAATLTTSWVMLCQLPLLAATTYIFNYQCTGR